MRRTDVISVGALAGTLVALGDDRLCAADDRVPVIEQQDRAAVVENEHNRRDLIVKRAFR